MRVRLAWLVRVFNLHRLDFPTALRRRPVGKVAAPGLAGMRMRRGVAPVAGRAVVCVRHKPVSE